MCKGLKSFFQVVFTNEFLFKMLGEDLIQLGQELQFLWLFTIMFCIGCK